MISHVIISYHKNIFFILNISIYIYIFTAKYHWKFTHNIVEVKIKDETSKVNNRTVSSMLREIPRPWRHKGIYIYVYMFQFNEYGFFWRISSDWSEWLLRVFFIPSIPFRKIKDRGREVLFYAVKLEPPFWDDKEDSVFNFVKEITLSMG